MSGVNKVILVGRLGKDPDVRVFESGLKRVSFTVATSEYYKDKDGNRVEMTEWHNIECWRTLAENAELYLSKGKLIYLEGKLKTKNWEDNGVKKYFTLIEANRFQILSPKNDESEVPIETKVQTTAPLLLPVAEQEQDDVLISDDLPF